MSEELSIDPKKSMEFLAGKAKEGISDFVADLLNDFLGWPFKLVRQAKSLLGLLKEAGVTGTGDLERQVRASETHVAAITAPVEALARQAEANILAAINEKAGISPATNVAGNTPPAATPGSAGNTGASLPPKA